MKEGRGKYGKDIKAFLEFLKENPIISFDKRIQKIIGGGRGCISKNWTKQILFIY